MGPCGCQVSHAYTSIANKLPTGPKHDSETYLLEQLDVKHITYTVCSRL
jgi:hypothetical protein